MHGCTSLQGFSQGFASGCYENTKFVCLVETERSWFAVSKSYISMSRFELAPPIPAIGGNMDKNAIAELHKSLEAMEKKKATLKKPLKWFYDPSIPFKKSNTLESTPRLPDKDVFAAQVLSSSRLIGSSPQGESVPDVDGFFISEVPKFVLMEKVERSV